MLPPTTARSPRRPARRRLLVAVVGVALAAVVVTACVPPPPPPPPPLSPLAIGVNHTVASRQYTFVDSSRATPAFDAYPGSPSRVLPTTVWYPSDGGGPFPLVVFVHGYGVTPAAYAPLLTSIASAGYVVAAATYPLLSGQPAGPTDTVGWDDLAPDTWFVTSQVLARSAAGDPALGGLIDPARIAVAGHSDGGAVAFNDGYTPYKLDTRVRAVVSYAAGFQYYGAYQANDRPVLHMLPDNDVYNPYGESISWDDDYLQPPKTVVSLWNATHEGPFMDPGDPHFDLVVDVTIGFLDSALKAHPESLYFAALRLADNPGLAALH